MRILLVGEAPGPADDGRTLQGRCGRRLADLIDAVDVSDAFDLVNLLDRWPGRIGKASDFPLAEARQAASELDVSGRPLVILLGRRVARAFDVKADWFEIVDGDPPLVVIPHPSGVNRYWNDACAVARAREFLLDVLDGSR